MLKRPASFFSTNRSSALSLVGARDVSSVPAPNDPESLFREHYERLFRSLAVASGDSEAAADSVQEVFIQLCLRWRRIKRRQNLAGWLRHAAVSRLTDGWRLRGSRPPSSSPTGVMDSPAEPLSEFRGDIETALSHLSRPERLALVLHYMEDLAPEDVAHAMGVSQDAALAYLCRAREKLQPNLMPGSWPETMIY